MKDTDRDELCRCESDCPGAAEFSERVSVPRAGKCPSLDECELADRDTVPPSAGDSDMSRGRDSLDGIDTKTNKELLAMVICAVHETRATATKTYDLMLSESQKRHELESRVVVLERDRFWGSKLPMALASVAILCSLLAVSVAAMQGWAMVANSASAVVR